MHHRRHRKHAWHGVMKIAARCSNSVDAGRHYDPSDAVAGTGTVVFRLERDLVQGTGVSDVIAAAACMTLRAHAGEEARSYDKIE